MLGGGGVVREEDTVDVLFHGNAYNLSATVVEVPGSDPYLAIDLEHLESGAFSCAVCHFCYMGLGQTQEMMISYDTMPCIAPRTI